MTTNEQRPTSLPTNRNCRKNDNNTSNIDDNNNKQYYKITSEKQNKHHGDALMETNKKNSVRIYHQNIRGAKIYNSWTKWNDGFKWLNENNVSVATLVETNTAWRRTNLKTATENAKKETNNTLLVASSSSEIRTNNYQPGGASCASLNSWTGYHQEKIKDSDGLGGWSGFKLKGKNKQIIIVLSAYRTTKSNDISDFSCYSQQWRIMRKKEDTEPKPREKFINDIIKKIK
jgi:hypothetical protein